MRRKNNFDTFKEAAVRRSYDEMPMLELGIDPQLHLSRNSVPQPFFLICEQDTMLAQMSGETRIEFREAAVRHFDMVVGDFVYVPGGTPHRLVPRTESIHLRYKAERPGLEAVAWYSEATGRQISRVTWDCTEELPQEAYLRACTAFNADAKLRTCPTSGAVLAPIDMSPFAWATVAAEIHEAEKAEFERARRKGAILEEAPRPERSLVIGAPPADRAPLKANAYLCGRAEQTQLSPMFPYFAPGAIVPCTAMFGSNHLDRGYFVHFNTVQEVLVCLGAEGAPYPYPGLVRVGPTTHPVGDKPGQSPSFATALVVITQRQAVDEPQNEAILFYCEKCDHELFRRDYGAHEFPDALDGPADPAIIGLPTISQSAASTSAFNDSAELRTCKNCGHLNPPFPLPFWGWEEYRRRTQVTVRMRKTMLDKAAAPPVAAE
jgi:3-hydroxyanthranilate 3,4-dioxygenase